MASMRKFTDGELRAVWTVLSRGRPVDLRNQAMFALGCACRWRISEMLSLRWQGVMEKDEEAVRDRIHIEARLTKTKRSSDFYPTPGVKAALLEWHGAATRIGRGRPGDWVFPNLGRGNGRGLGVGAMSRQAAWAMVKRVCRAAGIGTERRGTHSFKKTAVGNFYLERLERLRAGESVDPLRDTQRFSGHRHLASLEHYLPEIHGDKVAEGCKVAGTVVDGLMGVKSGPEGEA